MSDDPLALSEIWSELPNEADYDAIYVAIMATARGRWFLTQYANRNRNADTNALVGAIARVEATIRGNPPDTAVPYYDLTQLAAAIDHVKAVIAVNEADTPNGLAAAERIQDVAFALRERQADAALCDALDAAIREIIAACVTNEAAAQRARKAYELLRDLAARVGDMLAQSIAARSALRSHGGLFNVDVAEDGNFAQAVAALAALLPSLADSSEPIGFTAPADAAELASFREEEPPPGPRDDPAELFVRPAERTPPQSAVAAAPAIPREVPSDPFAAMRDLSEEELIALFS